MTQDSLNGIIAEYNPFHYGHLHHLTETKRLSPGPVIAVMSTCFTQRGEPAILSVTDRVRMALQAGVDAVFALPVAWSLRDAEHFAMAGVALLSGLGCRTLSFGVETQDLSGLQTLAHLLEHPDTRMKERIRTDLDKGTAFPIAQANAVEERLPGSRAILSTPNNNLALAYLRQIERQQSQMEPLPIQRVSDYHATSLDQVFPSATAVRQAVLQGDWEALERTVPNADILMEAALSGHLHRPQALQTAVLARLRCMEWKASVPDPEGLYRLVQKAAQKATNLPELFSMMETKRYTKARLQRLVWQIVLGADAFTSDLPNEAMLLGVRKDALPLLHRLGKARIPIVVRARELHSPLWETEARAWDLWALGAGLPGGLLYTKGIVQV